LQRLCLVPWRAHPHVVLLGRGQDHRHRLRMDWRDDCVRRRRQEAVDEVSAGDWLGLGAAIPVERRPDAGKCEQRSVVVQREPDNVPSS